MFDPIRKIPIYESLPTVPSVEEWRAMSPEAQLEFQIQVSNIEIKADEVQAQLTAAQARAERAQADAEKAQARAEKAESEREEAEAHAQRAQLQAELLTRSLRSAIFLILDLRNIVCPDEIRARIQSCREPDLLNHWLTRAYQARNLDDIFGVD